MENREGKNNKNRKKYTKTFRMLSVFLAACIFFTNTLLANPEMVSAASSASAKNEKKFGLTQTNLSLYVGNTFQLETVNDDTEPWGWVEYSSSDMSVAYVNSQGLIRAVGAGKADITANYMGQSAVCHVKVKENNCKLSETEIVLYGTQKASITLTNSKQKAVNYEYFIYNQESNYPVSSGAKYSLGVESKGDGTFIIQGGKPGKYYLDLSLTNKKNESYSARCKVELRSIGFESNGVAVAEGKTLTIAPENGEIVSCIVVGDDVLNTNERGEYRWGQDWDIEYYAPFGGMTRDESEDWDEMEQEEYEPGHPLRDEHIIVDEKGNITGVKEGSTRIVVDWKTAYGKMRQDWITVDVTVPEYIPFQEKFIVPYGYSPEFEGLSSYSKVTATSSDEDIIQVYTRGNGTISLNPQKEGKATIKYLVDGVEFKQKIQVIEPQWQNLVLVKKGKESEQALLTNVPSDCKITWKNTDKKVATVTKEGKVKGKGVGSTMITATLEGKTFTSSVTVGSGKGVDAALNGAKVLGASYSQEKRMEKGYYDCSSFVWRSYNEAGVKLGNLNYAPTAAELAKKLEAEGKAIAYEFLEADELKPGDLIFFGGEDNGRYKGIYHAVMYYGAYYGEDDENFGVVIHSTPGIGVVLESYEWARYGGIVMIVRPVK